MNRPALTIVAGLFLCATVHAVDFKAQVQPIFQQYCYRCHSEVKKSEKGKLVLDNLTRLATKIGPSGIIKPGDAAGSSLLSSLKLPAKDDDHMPPAKEPQPTPAHIAMVEKWIAEGASIDGKKTAAAPTAPTPPPPAAAGGAQTWTSTDGKTIQASFVRLEGENVVIQRADGVVFSVPLGRLSPESQAKAKNGGK